jgi:alternate signal-mediated exported protein
MNKLAKGAIATAAGIALLMGGAGTFAYWNASTGITGGTIVAGQLTITDATPSNGVWSVQKNGTGTATTVSLATYKASPGDLLTYTKNVTITAIGDNLTAKLSLAPGSISPSTAGLTPDINLSNYLSKTAVLSIASPPATIVAGTGGDAGKYILTPGTTGITNQAITITVALNFPKNINPGTTNGTVENGTMTGSVSLNSLAVNLDQS